MVANNRPRTVRAASNRWFRAGTAFRFRPDQGPNALMNAVRQTVVPTQPGSTTFGHSNEVRCDSDRGSMLGSSLAIMKSSS